ncbi:MAG: hypothetical protein ACYTF3_04795 [Planctomycetota bacterium]|jgi:hypothetical protein
MSEAKSSLATRRRKKQVTILAVLVGVTGLTWSKTLFGGSKRPAAAPPPGVTAVAPTPAAPRPGAPVPGGPAAAASAGAARIASFEQAMARMQVWPRALDRQVHVGPIEDIVPFEDLLGGGTETPEEAPILAPDPAGLVEVTPPPQPETELPDFEDLGLELTTTAIFGKTSYAVIDGERVKEGETLEIQVGLDTVRYEVSAILPRAVELRAGGRTHVLRISSRGPKLRGND